MSHRLTGRYVPNVSDCSNTQPTTGDWASVRPTHGESHRSPGAYIIRGYYFVRSCAPMCIASHDNLRLEFTDTTRWTKFHYNSITSVKSLSVCMTTFSPSLMNLTALLPQSRDNSCYVSGPILAPPPLWLQKHTDLHAQDFAHCPDLWHQTRLAKVTCVCSWRLCRINPTIYDGSSLCT